MTPLDLSWSHYSLSSRRSKPVFTANRSAMHLASIGQVSILHLTVNGILHVPKLTISLFSIGRLINLGYHVVFTATSCSVQDPRTGLQNGNGRRVDGLYELESLCMRHFSTLASPDLSFFRFGCDPFIFYLWHSRLGHLSKTGLEKLFSTGALGPVKSCDISNYSGRRLANCLALTFPNRMV